MSKELKLHVRKLQKRAAFSLIAVLMVVISIAFGIVSLFDPSIISAVFFLIAIISVVYLICSSCSAKKEEKGTINKPVMLITSKVVTFEELVHTFQKLTNKENQLSISNNIKFFRLNRIFKLRTIIYKTENFNKMDFDNAKNGANKKANKDLKITNWVNKFEAVKMMRVNIICTDTVNDSLYQFLSQNACHNLSRVEGVINMAVVGNQIVIPPLFGNCDLTEIRRYNNVIKFINEILLN